MTDATPEPLPPAEALQAVLERAIAAHQAWRYDEARTLYEQILAQEPRHADARHNLGVLLAVQLLQPEAALPHFEAALDVEPARAQFWFSYLDALVRAGHEGAVRQLLPLAQQFGLQAALVNSLLERLPGSAKTAGDPQARMRALVALFDQGEVLQGERQAREWIALEPEQGLAWKALGSMLQAQGRLDEALYAKRRAAELLPQDAEAHSNLGRALSELGRMDEAAQALRQALAIKPEHAEAHSNLGLVLAALGRTREALDSLNRAIALAPGLAAAYNNLSGVLSVQGRLQEAQAALKQALALEPDNRSAMDNLLFALNYDADQSAEQIYRAYADYERRFGEPLRQHWPAHANPPLGGRRLKVGYVSPDFRRHACSHFLEPLLAAHDRAALEVYAYAELAAEDTLTTRYKSCVDHWVPTRGLSDAALAQRIQDDGIDVLVDLAGHTAGNRLGVFARKPAPVAVSWLGYGYTTGLKAVDYLLTDAVQAPPGSEALFAEAPWRLSGTGYVYRPAAGMGEPGGLPAQRNGYVTFGTLTRAIRINDRCLRVWSDILKRLPDAHLVIDSGSYQDPWAQQQLAQRFLALGIDESRLHIGCHSPPWDVLRGIDITLDCFPHNSGTTLFESLYMGVPYVTLAGRPSVGRLGSTILQGLGRREWIAQTEEQYIAAAVALARDLDQLAAVRTALREQMRRSALMDEAGFARRVEQAYRQMFGVWAEQQTRKAPDAQQVQALVSLFKQGRHAEGEQLARAITQQFPHDGFGWKALGSLLQPQGKLAEAIAAKRRAVALLPQDAEAHANLGHLLQMQGLYQEAEAVLRRAVDLEPGQVPAWNNLGLTLQKTGRLREAEACFRKALQHEPDNDDVYGNLLFTLNYDPDYSAEEIFDAYRGYEKRFGRPLKKYWPAHANRPLAGRRLRLGYVSPDFTNHACQHFLEPLLASHDRAAVEVYAYAELAREDQLTARYKGYVEHWVPTRGISDAALAQRIRDDGIDVLVDLAGHTAGNRLGVFARKPAPVSVSWLGYGYTTGLAAVDYLLTDATQAPEGSEHLFSETPWRLQGTGYAYRPAAQEMGDVGEVPASRNGYVRFGTLTRAVRINQHSIRVWSEILKQVPASRLVIDSRSFIDPWACDELAQRFQQQGIAADRLEIGCHSPPWDVLRNIDIGLDCFPHNSGTTLFETLYMGVPYVTLAGRPSVGRLGSTILKGLGHPEWIADSEEEYIAKAVALAADTQQLAGLRAGLRGDMQRSALMDEVGFARRVEAAFGQMFERWFAKAGRAVAGTGAAPAQPDEREQNALVELFQQGRNAQGEQLARSLTLRYPQYGFGWKALGAMLQAQEKLAEALQAKRQAVRLMPEDVEARANLARASYQLGFLQEAEQAFRAVAAACPDDAGAHNNLGFVLNDLERFDEAQTSLRRALEIQPDFVVAWNNLTSSLKDQGRLREAEASAQQGLALDPNLAALHGNLGTIYLRQGRLPASRQSFEKAAQLAPQDTNHFSNLLFTLNYDPDKPAEEIFAAYQEYNRRFGEALVTQWRPHTNNPASHRRLKVGYVSPDFRTHPCCYFLEPLLAHHDGSAVEVYAYAELAREDEMTARFKGYAQHWVATRGMSDEALAQRIRADGIDILVDLAGHTGGNRLGVFARKPAPVSLSWLGYGYTTGLPAIDYLLTDEVLAPAGSEHLFAETPWRLPLSCFAYRARGDMGAVGELPALRNGFVTLGTLTRSERINHRTLAAWTEILRRLPNARLVIDSGSYKNPENREDLLRRFDALGVARERLQIGCTSPPWDVLRGIDIGLDCFPHNSGTTLFETLYMGVPVVTLAGRPSVGRLGSSILQALGRPEWIADSEQAYVDTVARLAQDVPGLARLRAGLRDQMRASALMDEAGFARRVEGAYRQMFQRWAQGQAAAPASPTAPPQQQPHRDPSDPLAQDEAKLRTILRILPLEADMHCDLANNLHAQGRLQEAEASWRQALQLNPDHVSALGNLGNSLREPQRLAEGEALLRRVLALQPAQATAPYNLGVNLLAQGRADEAQACFRQALRLKTDFAAAYGNLGKLLQESGDVLQAEVLWRQAIQAMPDFSGAYSQLGSTLQQQGRVAEAEVCHRQAVRLQPDDHNAHFQLGVALAQLGKAQEAEACYRRALALQPDLPGVWSNLADVLCGQGRLAEAEASARQALALDGAYVAAHANLATALLQQGRLAETVDSFRQALALQPDHKPIYNNYLFALNYDPDKPAEEIFEAYREYDRRFGQPLRGDWLPHVNPALAGRRLKVGYVSPDFRNHACRYFMEPLLASHDRSTVEVYAYAELAREDQLTARYKGYVEHWVPTRGISDAALAQRIRADGIDVLVDLAGHTAGNRLGVFARKPAPVSVSWLGYGYTTGLAAVDYLLTDATQAPEGSEHLFSETPWRLQGTGYAYRPAAQEMGDVGELPASRNGYVRFGTLTRAVRINQHSIRVWSEILKQVPASRLVIDSSSYKDPASCAQLIARFAEQGIRPEQLEIGYHSPPWDVLRNIDIGLDCFPHNSGTTLFETLYMGVPYVTLAGRPSVGRLGSTILKGLGHPEWIADTGEQYVAKAVALAGNMHKLAALRAGLRAEMQRSALMDEAGFARRVENAYQRMFTLWCYNRATP